MAHNYSLLKPYSLKESKIGDRVLIGNNRVNYKVVYVSTGRGVFEREGDLGILVYNVESTADIWHTPLLWVEDRPVYSGDKLYYIRSDSSHAIHYIDSVSDVGTCQNFHRADSIKGFIPKGTILVWEKPVTKVKKQGWVNVYSLPKRGRDLGDCYGIYSTKEDADGDSFSDRTDCIQIEWEEEEKE